MKKLHLLFAIVYILILFLAYFPIFKQFNPLDDFGSFGEKIVSLGIVVSILLHARMLIKKGILKYEKLYIYLTLTTFILIIAPIFVIRVFCGDYMGCAIYTLWPLMIAFLFWIISIIVGLTCVLKKDTSIPA